MKVNYNWLKEYVGAALPDAAAVDQLLTDHAFEIEEVEVVSGETVIDVDVLPNRSSDCLCHRGIARELATILDVQLEKDPLRDASTLTKTDKISVNIADTHACPRFTASLVTGITVAQSPDWLKTRLESLGQRSINNIVDATNYVMYAIGQPLHAYDADLFPQVDGTWQFGVRYGVEGEVVEILPEGGSTEPRQIECKGTELLVIDESSNTPIGLAGVKGGQFAGVHAGTTNIIVEAAHFHPTITRKTARRLGIVIDASKRFENECSRELPPYAQFEIIELIKQIAGGEYEGTLDVYAEEKKNPPVTVRVARVNAMLGLDLSADQVKAIIMRTGSVVEDAAAETFVCVGPWERTDLLIESDFVEEVGRLYGLDNIVSVIPDTATPAAVNSRQFYSEQVRQTLLGLGFSEVITSSFQNKDKIQLQNALASDKSYVRSSLRKNITKVLDENFFHMDLLAIRSVLVFEIGTVFSKIESGVGEHLSLALGVRQKGNGYTPKDDTSLQVALAELSEVLGVTLDFTTEQGVAEIDLSDVIVSLPVPDAYGELTKRAAATYAPVSPYPAMARDIALWVSEGKTADEVMDALRTPASDLCVRIDLFDEFTKDGRTSYAFRIVFQSQTKTLTDVEIGEVMDAVNIVVEEQGWEVR
ncbi:MAG: phenylalanyl-tRNA synthetase beta chain [Candidatus Paceibacteria bacterium]|jgi:phenylalanyl-tRNA synthetase beta chain